jgi:hypothetical protein
MESSLPEGSDLHSRLSSSDDFEAGARPGHALVAV